MEEQSNLNPLLVVRDAVRAIDFYVKALGARVLTRYEHGLERHVSHADLAVGAARFAVTEEVRAFTSDAPVLLAGSPVVPQLEVADTEGVLDAMTREGASAAAKDQSSLSDPRPLLQGPRIHLVLGPVGAGKSTFCLALAREQRAVRLTLDEWMTELFRPDRPESGVIEWYVERSARCCARIWSLARSLLEVGTSVILEIGLLQRRERERFYRSFADAGFPVTIHVIEAAREIRRERVLSRNRERGVTFSMHVPPEIFELASDRWEPLTPDECRGRDVRFIRTD